MNQRVVITGMGAVSPIGHSLKDIERSLREGTSGVVRRDDFGAIDGLYTRLAAPVAAGLDDKCVPRMYRRSMGPQSIFAAIAAQQAVDHAGLERDRLANDRTGVSIGSTIGSARAMHDFFQQYFVQGGIAGIKGTMFFQYMSHTCAANVALMLGITGRVLAPAAACASGSQSIGLAYEAIHYGLQDVMLAGGADEAHVTTAMTFDLLRATSLGYEDTPDRTPRPFDAERDGLVIGEGAGVLVLESLEHARARDATVYAEILGFATTSDGSHISQPTRDGVLRSMSSALSQSGVSSAEVDYINAHATATPVGDAVEAAAVRDLFGDRVPISATKGQTGHTLGACGALETIFCALMMNGGFVAGTRNLEHVDESCAGICHVQKTESAAIRIALSNNFAFGGVNTSLVLGAWDR